MTTDTITRILKLHDAGEHVATIADKCDVTAGYVYQQLREHRPDRERKPRKITSRKPDQIRALYRVNKNVARTAKLVKCSRAYAYRCLGDLVT